MQLLIGMDSEHVAVRRQGEVMILTSKNRRLPVPVDDIELWLLAAVVKYGFDRIEGADGGLRPEWPDDAPLPEMELVDAPAKDGEYRLRIIANAAKN